MKHIQKILKDIANPNSFEAQYSDPRWKERATSFRHTCSGCHSCRRRNVQLHVHHINYTQGVSLWDAGDEDLVGLCKSCHDLIHVAIRDFRRTAAYCNASNIAAICLALKLMIQRYGDQGTLRRLVRADEFNES